MNQDRVKATLQELHPTAADFTVIFSGKKSKVVNGLYKPASREIIIHNRNFEDDNNLFFTALHEYAHHIDCTENTGKARGHSIRFWATFHNLLGLAESKKAYENPTKKPEFSEATKALTAKIEESGKIMREIGALLIEAKTLCEKNGARFDDYVMRTLRQPLPWAIAAMHAATYRLDPALGAENMKTVAAIRNDDERDIAAEELKTESPQQVKAARAAEKEPEDPLAKLERELKRIEKTILTLADRAAETEKKIEELRGKDNDRP